MRPQDKITRLDLQRWSLKQILGHYNPNISKKCMSTFCESSISFGSCRATSDCFLYVYAGHIMMINNLFNSFNTPQYAITVDTSPYSFCTEAILVGLVDDKKGNLVETLADLNVYEQSPNGEEAAASLLHFMNRFHLYPENWVCVMMDGCSVNTNAVDRLCEQLDSINIKRVRCLSYFFIISWKKIRMQ